jgi:hypothetical protein
MPQVQAETRHRQKCTLNYFTFLAYDESQQRLQAGKVLRAMPPRPAKEPPVGVDWIQEGQMGFGSWPGSRALAFAS